jgi:hypothetical protein
MQIKKVLHTSYKEFYAIYKCEFCGFEREGYGTDETAFYDITIPSFVCWKCDKSTKSEEGK